MPKKIFVFVLFVLNYSIYCQHSEVVRIAAYNVKQFPDNNNVTSSLKTVVSQINPTILMMTELDGSTAVQQVLNNVLSNKYKGSTEVNITWGYGNECAVFYLDSLLTYLGLNMISADTRPIAEFKFVHKITNDTLIIFAVHLKAYPEQTSRRLNAVNSLRIQTAQLNKNANYIVLGDFNTYTSEEPGFQKLLDQSSAGYFYDLLNAVGNWSDNSTFAFTHTYSPKFLKNRFDMILISQSIKDKGGIDYLENSFKILGNDGNHFQQNITTGSNYWLTSNSSLGSALVNASDHLPVYADFNFGVVPNEVSTTQTLPTKFELMQNYPNPFNPETVIRYQLPVSGYVSLKVYDLLGNEVVTLVNEFQNAGLHNSQFSLLNMPAGRQGSTLSSSVYFYQLKVGNFVQTKKMMLIK